MEPTEKKEPSPRKADVEKIRLLKRREAALVKLNAGLRDADRKRRLVVGTTTAARLLGITPEALAKMLEPVSSMLNARHRSGSMVTLYDPIDLVRISKQKRVEKARARSTPARKEAAKRVAETRRSRVLAEAERIIESWKPHFPDWTWNKLRDAAIGSYRQIAVERGKEPSGDRINDDVCRLVLNFLRHQCSTYDETLNMVAEALRGRVGRNMFSDPVHEASQMLHDRITDLAKDTWSELCADDLLEPPNS